MYIITTGNLSSPQKNVISPFFDASGNKNIGATIRIGQEIQCLPYAGFLLLYSQIRLAALNEVTLVEQYDGPLTLFTASFRASCNRWS